jgi:hypothetical protein
MVKNSGDTQARFLAKSLAFLAISRQYSALSKRKIYRKGREERKETRIDKDWAPQICAAIMPFDTVRRAILAGNLVTAANSAVKKIRT